MKNTFFQKNKLPLLISLLVSLCVAYFFVDKMGDKTLLFKESKNQENELALKDSTFKIPYTYQMYMDTSFLNQKDTTNFEAISALPFFIRDTAMDKIELEKLPKSMFKYAPNPLPIPIQTSSICFTTRRDLRNFETELIKLLSKPDSIPEKIEGWDRTYTWRNKTIFEHKNLVIEYQTKEEQFPPSLVVEIKFRNQNLDFLEDNKVEDLFSNLIKQHVFTSPFIKRKENTDCWKKSYGCKEEVNPINYDLVLDSYFNKNEYFEEYPISLEVFIGQTGKIEKWNVEWVGDRFSDKKEISQKINQQLTLYLKEFQYPILYTNTQKNEVSSYKAVLIIQTQKYIKQKEQKFIQEIISLLNKKTNFTEPFSEDYKFTNDYIFEKPKDKIPSQFAILKNYIIYVFSHQNKKWSFSYKQKSIDDYKNKLVVKDMDADGIPEIILIPAFGNMNGNTWSDIYKQENGKFVLKAESLTSIEDYVYNEYDSIGGMVGRNIVKKPNVIITFHEGSWYMPHYTNIYKWENGNLIEKAYTENKWLYTTMSERDFRLFSVRERVNDSLQITENFIIIDEKDELRRWKIEEELIEKYNK